MDKALEEITMEGSFWENLFSNPLGPLAILFGIVALATIVSLIRSIRVVPNQTALVVERLGKFSKILNAGFHVLFPFIDKVAYTHSLKEIAIDVPAQDCFTEDNVKVTIDGVLYFKVIDPKKASYGICNYRTASIQMAQTTMRSVIGKMELDKTFEERDAINATIVGEVDEASDPWGVHVTRYEIQNITVPNSVMQTMEMQVRAEREKRAVIAQSIGEMESKINYSLGIMEEAINRSEGEKQKMINEAEGRAAEILAVSRATAIAIAKVAEAMDAPGGEDAVTLQLVEKYIGELSKLSSRSGTKVILPMDLTDLSSITKIAEKVIQG